MDILSRYHDLTVGNWISLILVFTVGAFLVQAFHSWYRLRHFKGPFLASLTRLWLVRHAAGGRMHLEFQEVNQKYGMFNLQLALDPLRMQC